MKMMMMMMVVGQIANRVGPPGRLKNQTAGKPDRETECLDMQDAPPKNSKWLKRESVPKTFNIPIDVPDVFLGARKALAVLQEMLAP
jgi:hypothetical protein